MNGLQIMALRAAIDSLGKASELVVKHAYSEAPNKKEDLQCASSKIGDAERWLKALMEPDER